MKLLEWDVKTDNEHNCISIPTLMLAMDACVAACANKGRHDHQGTGIFRLEEILKVMGLWPQTILF